MKKHQKYSLFIGRWQPFHKGHKYIIDHALKQGKNIAIAIRDTEISEKNPYTTRQREEMIRRVYPDPKKVHIFPMVDIESINIGRNVGYKVKEIEAIGKVKQISGTKIRKKGTGVHVDKRVKDYLQTLAPTFWFFGLPCSGKTTLADELKKSLESKESHIIRFDGDTLRNGLNKDLAFSKKDRTENLRRAANIAQMFNEKGHTTICSFVTPSHEMRKMIKKIINNICFIWVKCSIKECEKRDVKGMYKKARKGEIKNFTGISAPFDNPKNGLADVIVDSKQEKISQSLKKIIKQAKQIEL